jgi:NAD(P)-dependent dehydrogenase (short-subunit alcohol dehydrogenase family)
MNPDHCFSLHGKNVFLTGASGGIGKSIATLFAQQGANLFLVDLDLVKGEELVNELSGSTGNILFSQINLADKSSVETAIQSALNSLDHIDILICCAGIEGHIGNLLEADDESWQTLMTINLQSSHWLAQGFAKSMSTNHFGRIIMLSSIAGLRGNKAIGLYGIAKAGLSQLARNLAIELGPDGIAVNCIAPGLIETPLSKKLMNDKKFVEKRLSMTPLRRVGQAEEVAGLALYLASNLGGFVSGQTLVIDGGTLITDGN